MGIYRHFCEKCNRIYDFDTRRKRIICPICGSDISSSPLYYCRLVGETFYKGEFSFTGKALIIPEGSKVIESYAFEGNWRIEKITFPKTLTSISLACFRNCEKLKELIIPGSVKEIGFQAFAKCSSLEKVVIEEGTEIIASSAFSGCTNLKHVLLPSTLKIIKENAFYNCTSIDHITIPEGVQEIESRVFAGCSSLKYVYLPQLLEIIGEKAFDTGITVPEKYKNTLAMRIVLPPTIKTIGDDAFGSIMKNAQFFVTKKTAAAKYARNCGALTILTQTTHGEVIAAPANGETLYYANKVEKIHSIRKGTVKVAQYAFYGCSEIEELIIPASVKEIGAFAFCGANRISKITFEIGSKLETVGSCAFDSFCGDTVDLPNSTCDIAPDAFPETWMICVNSDMPFYEDAIAELDKRALDIAKKENNLLDLEHRFDDADKKLRLHIASFPAETSQIDELKKTLSAAISERDTVNASFTAKLEYLNKLIAEAENEVSLLIAARKEVFFLFIRKKRELDENIAIKEAKLQHLKNGRDTTNLEYEDMQKRLFHYINSTRNEIYSRDNMLRKWESDKISLTRDKTAIDEKKRLLASNISDLRAAYLRDRDKIERQHSSWMKARSAGIERIKKKRLKEEEEARKKALLDEKFFLLSKLVVPNCQSFDLYSFASRNNIIEETLLNEAFLNFIVDTNKKEGVETINRFVSSNSNEIERIKKINEVLGLPITNGIDMLKELEFPIIRDNYLPERFEILSGRYSSLEIWRIFKRGVKSIFHLKNNKRASICDNFFANIDHFVFTYDKKSLFFFPYCMVLYQWQKPLSVLTYSEAKLSVKYKEIEEVTDTTAQFGEVVSEHHKYLKKDGTLNLRYKNNPIIKTVRYTTVTISAKRRMFTFPCRAYDEALRFETVFSTFSLDITTGLIGNAYKHIMNSSDIHDIETAISDAISEDRRQGKLKKQKALEEKQRLENEKREAEKTAELIKQAAIQRQRELNELRRRQAEEKKKALQLFEDDFSPPSIEHERINDETANSETKFCVIGNTVITNCVFKVVIEQKAEFSEEEIMAFFALEDNSIISGKKIITVSSGGDRMTLGFVLNSGIDYTRIKKCFMIIQTVGNSVQKIEFKMNIAFCSDF